MRILCISPFVAPLANAEAFCGGKVALGLLEAGADVRLFTVDYTGHPKFRQDASSIWAPLASVTDAVSPAGGKSKLSSLSFGLRYQSLHWTRWIATVVARAEQQHARRPFDVIYTRGLPNVAHVAGYWLKRSLRLPWVANFNDPWDLEATHLLPDQRSQRKRTVSTTVSDLWLRRVVRAADVITFPCERLLAYHRKLTRIPARCEVIPHIGYGTPTPQPAGEFTLLHAGNLGVGESTRRDATTNLLAAIGRLIASRPQLMRSFKLKLVGPEDPKTRELAQRLGLDRHVVFTGSVSYAESLRHIGDATVCLLVEGKMSEGIFLPSKLPDYICAGRPILALSPSAGTIADLAQHGGITRASVDDAAAIEAALVDLITAGASGTLDRYRPTEALRSRFSPERLSAALLDILRPAKRAASAPTELASV